MVTTKREFISTPIGGEFGISVALDTLQDVVDYRDKGILKEHGYPRFVPHRSVTRRESLAMISSGMPHAVAFPSKQQACFILNDFILRNHRPYDLFPLDEEPFALIGKMHPGRRSAYRTGRRERLPLVEVDGLHIVCLKNEADAEALVCLRRLFGSGFDVHRLSKVMADRGGEEVGSLEGRILEWEGDRAKAALLFQSGMAAISALILLAVQLERRLVLIGPMYADTGLIASTWQKTVSGLECEWLPCEAPRERIEEALDAGPSLLLLEIPSNPSLWLPDIPLIVDIAQRRDAILCADATIATPFNFKGLDAGFDIVAHSTSKFLGGRYDHLGGVIAGASASVLEKLNEILDDLDLGMCANQRAILRDHLAGFEKRMKTINKNALAVVDRLSASPLIDEILYPGRMSPEQDRLAKMLLKPGRGGLVSFTLKEKGMEPLRRFFDAISPPLLKGPGFGGETSIICPSMILAHGPDDEELLGTHNLDLYSLTLSVGIEPADDIVRALGIKP